MSRNRLTSSSGFTLVAAMAAVVIVSIMAGVSEQSWKMFMKREREEELIFRGTQYMIAIKRWYNPHLKTPQKGAPPPKLNATNTRPLRDLKHLLQDPNSLANVRYLRRIYLDPVTGKDFEPVKDAYQAIIGVRSTSDLEPLKKANFPDELLNLEEKKKYSEWEFVYRTQPLTKATTTKVTPPPQ